MNRLAILGTLAVLVLVTSPPAWPQSSDELKTLRKDIEILRDGMTAIQKDLQEIKTLLRGRPAAQAAPPQEVVLNLDGVPAKGSRTARVTLVDITDYQ